MTNFNPTTDMKSLETDPNIGVAEPYKQVLSKCPVSRVDIPGAEVDWWGVWGYDELLSVLKNFRAMSSTVSTDKEGIPSIVPLFADPPYHTPFRKLLNPNFPIEMTNRIEPDIRIFADEMVGELVDRQEVDFYRDFARKFPPRVLCRFMGVPDEDWPIHFRFSGAFENEGPSFTQKPSEAKDDRYDEFMPYIHGVIAAKRANPGDDLVSSFVTGTVDGRPLEDGEVARLVIAMMLAGHATTTAAIANFVLRLASDQELQAFLREHPERIPDALEECLRMDTPQQSLLRKCVVDTELGGQTIKAGEFLFTNYGSANVDPRKFPEPEKFDIDRAGRGHLAFGFGLHLCLGQHLARLDMRIAMETLLARTSSITINGPVKRVTWPVLCPVELPLRLEPAAA